MPYRKSMIEELKRLQRGPDDKTAPESEHEFLDWLKGDSILDRQLNRARRGKRFSAFESN